MIQLALLICSIGLIVIGIKGLSGRGIALSKTKTLTGPQAKAVGVACIIGGLALIPALFLIVWLLSRR